MIKFIKNIFTQNDWEVIQETTTESQMEHMMRVFGKCVTPKYDYQLTEMTKRKVIIILQCKNTGKIKKYVENI